MFYYKYDKNSCVITDKSTTAFEQPKFVCHSDVDFDLDLNQVVVGHVSDCGELLRYTVFVRPVEELVRILKETRNKIAETDIAQLDFDFRLCKIELGI